MQDWLNRETHVKTAFDPELSTPIYKRSSLVKIPEISATDFLIRYVEISANEQKQLLAHSHGQYELYVNCANDVSFIVENDVFPLSHGDALLMRPGVLHNCICNTNRPHEHYWALFSFQGDDEALDGLFGEKDVLIALSDNDRPETLSLCEKLIQPDLSDFKKHVYFFRFLNLFSSSENHAKKDALFPRDVRAAIDYIHENLLEDLTVSSVAKASNVSVNTLERHFHSFLKISPLQYIQKQRLFRAADLLSSDRSVLEVGLDSGFPDCSHFIVLFKKHYGMTPTEYRNRFLKK